MVQTLLPYHRVMSPKWIHNNAVITVPFALYPQYFEILPTTGNNYQRALRVQLIAPDLLKSNDNITVTITVALDVTVANSGDHDISLGISDGVSFIGFIAHDKGNYGSISPCHKLEGDVIKNGLKNVVQGNGATVSARRYSGEIKIQIKPTEQWGSCHTEHDEGYVNIQNYQPLIDLSKPLYFEVYRQNPSEKYRIKYIVVDVDLD